MKNIEAVGKITWLMGHSDQHCDWSVDDIHRLIIPPVALQQFRIWQVDEHPVGLMTWALFNEETEAGYLDGSRKIQPEDWNAGDRLWLVDFIAPYGNVREMVREGRDHLRSIFGKGVVGRANRLHRGKLWYAVT